VWQVTENADIVDVFNASKTIFMHQESTHPAALQRHTGTPADLRVGTAVALSSVAKYWVLTNLFPGPIPQVSVYGLHHPRVSLFEISQPLRRKHITNLALGS
jgi:hypothetical protein